MATFRLGHISDLHFSQTSDRLNPVDGPDTNSSLTVSIAALAALMNGKGFRYPSTFKIDVALGLLNGISESFRDLDALVVTGDLATTGSDEDLIVAKNYFMGSVPPEWNPVGEVPSLQDELGPQVICLPGNHDRYEGTAHKPSYGAFERHFGLDWDTVNNGKTYSIAGADSRVKVAVPTKGDSALVMVLADLSLQDYWSSEGATGWLGQGKALPQVVRDMQRSTRVAVAAAKREGIKNVAPVWAVHFPPHFPDLTKKLKLLDPDELVDGARNCGVDILIAGHTHRMAAYSIVSPQVGNSRGGPTVYCCGATTGISWHGRHTFSVLDIEVAGDKISHIRTRIYEWDKTKRLFVDGEWA